MHDEPPAPPPEVAAALRAVADNERTFHMIIIDEVTSKFDNQWLLNEIWQKVGN